MWATMLESFLPLLLTLLPELLSFLPSSPCPLLCFPWTLLWSAEPSFTPMTSTTTPLIIYPCLLCCVGASNQPRHLLLDEQPQVSSNDLTHISDSKMYSGLLCRWKHVFPGTNSIEAQGSMWVPSPFSQVRFWTLLDYPCYSLVNVCLSTLLSSVCPGLLQCPLLCGCSCL